MLKIEKRGGIRDRAASKNQIAPVRDSLSGHSKLFPVGS